MQISVWEPRFNNYVREDKFAQEVFDKLLARCQRQTVTGQICAYCLDTTASEARADAAKWLDAIELLSDIGSKSAEASRILEEIGEAREPVRLVVQYLKFGGDFFSLVVPAMKAQTNLRHSHGKSVHLVRLSLYIREATEGVCCDEEVAYLVEKGFLASGHERDFSGNAVFKIRDRLRERNSELYELFELQAAEYFAQFGREGDPESKPPFLEWCSRR